MGAALPEAALVLGLLFLILFGIMEFSGFLFNRSVIINASREGARLGSMFRVSPENEFDYSPPDDTEITRKVLYYSADHLLGFRARTTPQVEISPSWSSRQASGPGTPLRVDVNHQFQFLLLPALTTGLVGETTISAQTTMRME